MKRKRGRGRPSLGKLAQAKHLGIRLTEKELDQWQEAADKAGLGLSAWVRLQIRKVLESEGLQTGSGSVWGPSPGGP